MSHSMNIQNYGEKDNYRLVKQDQSQASEKSLLQIMVEITDVLNKFEDIVGKFDSEMELKQAAASKLAAASSQGETKLANKQLKKIEKAEKEQEKSSFWGKVFRDVGIAATIVSVVVLCALGMPEVALIVGVVGIAASTGLMSKFRDEIAKGFELMGIPPAASKLLADAVIAVIVIAGTFGAGSVAGLEAGGEVAAEEAVTEATSEEAATETVTETASEEGTTETTAESQTVSEDLEGAFNRAKELVGKVKRAIGPRLGATIVNQGQMVGGLNIAADIANALPVSDKKKEKILTVLEIVQTLEMILSALVGGGGLSTAATSTTAAAEAGEAGEEASTTAKALSKLQGLAIENSGTLMKLQAALKGSVGVGTGTTQLIAALDQMKIADDKSKLGRYQAAEVLSEQTMEMADQGIKAQEEASERDSKSIADLQAIAHHLTDVMGETAQLLA